jgi:peptidoglycan/xylan/chitin deacetylase (PgdA/CDA1 family)
MGGASRIRMDRLLSLYLFRPYREITAAGGDRGVPILMYHGITPCDDLAGHPYYQLNTSPERFAQQMGILNEKKYDVVNLADLPACFTDGQAQGKKYVAITFDDGFHNFLTNAYPILDRYGFKATVFLPTAFIDDDRRAFKGHECLVWREIRQLADRGIVFGSHTVSHPQLNHLGRSEVERELGVSKKTIEDSIGMPVEAFSYPYAFPEHDGGFRSYLKTVLSLCGYRIGVCTRIGTVEKTSDRLLLSRVPVNDSDDPVFFESKLTGCYDWLGMFQYMSKALHLKRSSYRTAD